MKYGNRSLWKKIVASPISLVALAVLAFVLGKAAFNINDKVELSEARLALAQAELTKLEDHQDEVSRKVAALSTDQGIEAEIRTRFHAVKEGESVAVIVDDQAAGTALTASVGVTATSSVSWWRKILRVWFSGRMRPSQG